MLFYQLVIGVQMLLNTNWNTAIKKYYIIHFITVFQILQTIYIFLNIQNRELRK